MCAARTGEVKDTQEFVNAIDTVKTAAEFDSLDAKKIQDFPVFDYESKGAPSPVEEYNKNDGY
jgi:hypothetical protein